MRGLDLERPKFTFIHPVHAAFPFADLSHESISLERFFELFDGIDQEDRYLLIDDIAPLVRLKKGKRQHELEKQLKRFRQFKEACMKMDVDKAIFLRGIIQQILNHHFQTTWPETAIRLATNSEAEHDSILSCELTDFELNNQELWNSRGVDTYSRIQSNRLYLVFCEHVVGPLVGYC